LLHIMKTFDDGAALRVVEKDHSGSIKELAQEFLLYGALSEVFARRNGFNKGLGGSMHAFFTPFGIYPNNALVGGSADIAAGAALFKKVNSKKGIVIANIGDASMGCGPVWEALNFSSMSQFTNLWDDAHKGGLPIIFSIANNFYGMGGQTHGETMAWDMMARLGAGVNKDAMHSERIDGFNPLAVIDAISRKKSLIEKGSGPVLLDVATYRFSGHSPSDASSYREKEEIQMWQDIDPLKTFAEALVKEKILDDTSHAVILEKTKGSMGKAYRLSIDLEISPRLDPEEIAGLMFSNKKVEKYDDREPEVLMPMEDNVRVQQLKRKARFGLKDGKPLPKNRVYQYRDAIFESIINKFYTDSTLIAYGEENRDWGGAFACYRGLTEALPYHRLFNSPISEAAIVGSAVGYALEGGRVLVELMYCDFMGRAGDEIFNQMAKWQSMSAGVLEMPLVLRVSVGAKYGAQHSQDWVALVNHIPGLKVVFPVTPYDAKGMLNTALNGSDPVVFFESQGLYDQAEVFEEGGVPEEYYEIEFGAPALRRSGTDLTIVTVGATLYRAMEAAEILQEKYGISAEVFDARSINPLDYEPIIESIKKTGRVLLSSDACTRGSVMQMMAANLTQYAFDYLDAPPVVVGARNWITPCAEQEEYYFPQTEWLLDAIHQEILPLSGHSVTSNHCSAEAIRRNRLAI
ncbi:MAG: dehydrogenase, partial [Planctomycetes bacterium]|nr:dehydrogenase [Planctomycetota bacterium]